MTGWYAGRMLDRSAKAVIGVTLVALLLVAAVPAALLAGVLLVLFGQVLVGLILFGGSILAATAAVVVAGMSGMRLLRKRVAGYLQRQERASGQQGDSSRIVQLDRSEYTEVR
jgi:uncharacterized membrane protein YdjX (TVP38/TMEM64 family)